MGKQSKRRKDIPKVRASILDSMVHHQSSAVDGYRTPSFILKANVMEHENNPWNLDGIVVASECVGMLYPREPLPKLEGNEKLLLAGVSGSLLCNRTELNVGEKQMRVLVPFEDARDAIAYMQRNVWMETWDSITYETSEDALSTVCGCLILIKTSPNKKHKGCARERVFVGALVFDTRPILVTPKIFGMENVFDWAGTGRMCLEKILYCMLCRTHGHLIRRNNGKALADALVDTKGAEAMCSSPFKEMMQELVYSTRHISSCGIVRKYYLIHVILKRRLWTLQMGHCAKRSQSLLRMVSQDAFRSIIHHLFHELWMKQREAFAEEKSTWFGINAHYIFGSRCTVG